MELTIFWSVSLKNFLQVPLFALFWFGFIFKLKSIFSGLISITKPPEVTTKTSKLKQLIKLFPILPHIWLSSQQNKELMCLLVLYY